MKLKTTTTVDPSIRLQFLIERHQALDDEADELQTRSYLSPYDRDRLKLVKVMRLKEAVEKFRREIGRNDNIHVN